MGKYNPHAPQILGQEWVPIRQANFEAEDPVERGYTFQLDHATAIVSGAYYVEQPPLGRTFGATFMSVYPAGTENQSGPIKSVVIPVSGVSVTGSGYTSTVASLANPADIVNTTIDPPGNAGSLGISFDVASYSQQLYGKRILDVRVRYIAFGEPNDLACMHVQLNYASNIVAGGILYKVGLDGGVSADQGIDTASSLSLSELNPLWRGSTTFNEPRIYPWRYQELLNLSLSSAVAALDRLVLYVAVGGCPSVSTITISYMALEIIYCEEQRVLYGGDFYGPITNPPPLIGPKMIQFRTPAMALPGNTNPGEYSVVLTGEQVVHTSSITSNNAGIRNYALRELYQLPTQRGVAVGRTDVIDGEFSVDETDVLPQLTLHTASAIVTGCHPYGVQYGAPVYGSIVATQEIEDDPVGSAAVFPQVRFYARRFGDTTQALRLIDVATGLSFASISVADFDALPEIVDGWKEVNLRFDVPPTFSTAAGDVDWRFDSVGETAGNQWQVLAADGPSFTGTHAMGAATYYAPSGATVALTWQSPTISGTAEDSTTDAVLIFSQDPSPVSGFALDIEEQEVASGLDDCGVGGCLPTAISYVNLTWDAQTSLPVTGFGAYEIERYDSADGAWRQVANVTDPSVVAFDDYEARVGLTSWYRIRTCNVLDFCGPWVTGSATVPAPGVTVGGNGNSVLIFTSNVDPTRNLAYVMVWDNTPIEQFVFPEADEVQLQRMFGRDYFVAFHPLERGGAQFTRVIVVNLATMPAPSLANFTDMRDLAWASLPYVCIRDELGNRWLANVRVPAGDVRADRTIYLAQIRVAEVTDTPYPYDPS